MGVCINAVIHVLILIDHIMEVLLIEHVLISEWCTDSTGRILTWDLWLWSAGLSNGSAEFFARRAGGIVLYVGVSFPDCVLKERILSLSLSLVRP